MATSQLAENQQRSYEVFGKKHYMACTTQKRAAFQVMGSKTMQCSPAFPLVLTSYKLLEIERTPYGHNIPRPHGRSTAAGQCRAVKALNVTRIAGRGVKRSSKRATMWRSPVGGESG